MKMSISELAEVAGMSRRTVSRRLRGLEPEKIGPAHKYVTADAMKLLYAVPVTDGDDLDLSQERARLAKVQTEIAQLKKAEIEGDLIPAEQVLAEWNRISSTVRSKLLALPSKLAPVLIGQEDHGAIHSLIQGEIYAALTELSQTDEPDTAQAGDADDG